MTFLKIRLRIMVCLTGILMLQFEFHVFDAPSSAVMKKKKERMASLFSKTCCLDPVLTSMINYIIGHSTYVPLSLIPV